MQNSNQTCGRLRSLKFTQFVAFILINSRFQKKNGGKFPLADELDTFFSRLNQHDASDGFSRQTRTNNQVLAVDEQLVTSF